MKTLSECRVAIDAIDNQMLELLNERMNIVKRVGEIKNRSNESIYKPEREKSILERLSHKSLKDGGLLNSDAIEAIFLEIFAVSRNLELPERIAYLGPEGSFTHQAAESRFGAMSDYTSLNSIFSVFREVETKRAKFGVVPIENSRDGIVAETLDLLAQSHVKIVAELYMPIRMSFATKAKKLTDITKIYSKDKGFGQCLEFLQAHGFMNIEHIPVESTAKAAILASADENSAAICSHIAAKLYGLPMMFDHVEDEIGSQTRFVILSDFKNEPNCDSKTSILVNLKDSAKAGTLVHFLQDFNEEGINLSKIESRPSKQKGGFEYLFFIDFDGHIDEPSIQRVMSKHDGEVVWLGSYIKGQSVEV